MRAVIKRDVVVFESELLAEGTADELDLEALDTLFAEGELGQLDLFLDPSLPDSRFAEAQQATDELEADLLSRGALPWPAADQIAVLDWPGRVVTFRFQQGALFFAAFFAGLAAWLLRVGLTYGPGLFRAILAFFRSFPLLVSVIGGAALILLLAPEGTAYRVFRWVGKAVGKIGGEVIKGALGGLLGLAEGLGPLALVGTAGLVVAGVYMLRRDQNG